MPEEVTHHAIQASAHVATGATVGSGFMAFMTENATVIGLSMTAISLVVALTFYVLNYRLNKKRLENSERALRDSILAELADKGVVKACSTDVSYVPTQVAHKYSG